MSHFIELLIESYNLLIETSVEARKRGDYRTEVKLYTQAMKIKKRMKSLGHHNCWEEFGDEVEVELP